MRFLAFVMSAMLGTAIDASMDDTLHRRETPLHLFKGEKIPEINWTSKDTYNFTLGLTGVDNFENLHYGNNLWITLSSICGILLIYRLCGHLARYVRLITSLGGATSYWGQPLNGTLAFFEKHVNMAPLFSRRHNEALQLRFPKLHLGTLPLRINTTFVFLYFASNVVYCTIALPWSGRIGPDNRLREPTKAALVAEFRGRTGTMAVVNIIPLLICMMRNNYLGRAMGVSFNTWNLYHRWLGRIVVLESWAHMGAWTVNQIDYDGWEGWVRAMKEKPFFQVGMMAEAALLFIIFLSVSPIRHSHYQVFLTTHQILIIFFLVGLWLHCYYDQLPRKLWVEIAMAIWGFERAHRLCTILRRNVIVSGVGLSATIAEVRPMFSGEDAVHVSIKMRRGWKYRPGTHAYIYIPRLSWLQSHPFSIAWSSFGNDRMTVFSSNSDYRSGIAHSSGQLPLAHRGLQISSSATTIHFIINRKKGFTNALYRSVHPSGEPKDEEKRSPIVRRFLAFVEGPYKNEAHSYDSYATALFIAGGSGITHPLGHIRHLLTASIDCLVATKRIKLVWAIRDLRNITWISEWLDELWRLDAGRKMLEVEVYVTRPQANVLPASARVKWLAGRPQAGVLIDSLLAKKTPGIISVNACGPGGLSDSVRAAVRERIHVARIDFSEESFTWS